MDGQNPLALRVRNWLNLADEYEAVCRRPAGPILRAMRSMMLPGDMAGRAYYLSFQAEQLGLDTSNLLRFVRRPSPGDQLDEARVVLDRLMQRIIARELGAESTTNDDIAAANPFAGQSAAGVAPAFAESPTPDGVLSVTQAATVAGVSTDTIRRACERGDLPATNFGSGKQRFWRIRTADLLHFLSRKTEKAARRSTGGGKQRTTLVRPSHYKARVLTDV